MDFGGLAQTFEIALGVWFAALAGAVIYRCLNGQIPLRGILAHDAAALAAGQPAGERVQLLLAFIFSVGAYAQMALAQQGATALPDPPQQLVAIFAASHGIYLTGKLGRTARLGRFLFNKGE